MTTEEIVAKLAPMFAQEGLELEIVAQEGQNLNVRARRVASGVPVAFLLKAMAGTFRRYHSEIREVVLIDYDPGDQKFAVAPANPDFDKVLRHGSKNHQDGKTFADLGPDKIPALDLRGCTRQSAVRALQTARKIWSSPGVFAVRGLADEAVARAFEKWKHHDGDVAHQLEIQSEGSDLGDLSLLVLTVAPDLLQTWSLVQSSTFRTDRLQWMPAKIILTDEPNNSSAPEDIHGPQS